jgi:hypothetical protein
MPHENDTEDLDFQAGTDTEDIGYNHMHSKMWNDVVDRKAQEFENAIKKQEQ